MATIEEAREVARRRILGVGLECAEVAPGVDVGRDIALVQGPNGLDLARVIGVDNLGQSLAIALTTARGSDVFDTGFGFDGLNAVAEETNPILARERIRIAIVRLLLCDRRVARIVDVKLDDGRLEPVPAGRRELDVKVLFETRTGDRAAAQLGRVVTDVG